MRTRALPLLICALGLAACGTSAPPPPDLADSVRRAPDPCTDLARAFYLIAEKRDRRVSRAAQAAAARESVENPWVADPQGTLRDLLHVIDLVYSNPALDAREIEASVLDHCEVNEQGQAVVSTSWSAL